MNPNRQEIGVRENDGESDKAKECDESQGKILAHHLHT